MDTYNLNYRMLYKVVSKMYKTLIVDDDRAIRYELKKSNAFSENGFSIAAEASDGKEALDKVINEKFDIAIVDIKMPRVNGIQFIQELRSMGNKICIVIISGSSDFSYARQAIKLGAFDYLLKPIDEKDLNELLKSAGEFLSAESYNKHIEEKNALFLAESLKLPYSTKDEQKLYEVLITDPDSSSELAKDIFNKLSDFYEEDVFKIAVILDSCLKNLLDRMNAEMPWIGAFQLLESNTYLQQIDNILLLSDSFCEEIGRIAAFIKKLHINSSNSLLRRLCEYIFVNIDKKITLDTASEELNYSSKYLGKIFKELTNESIVDYITKVKMERAKVLIRSGKYKNYEISEILGYKNPDYFTKLFKDYNGITPADYKNALR